MNHALLRVMLDPLSYLDPSRLPSGAPLEAGARAALNRLLIQQHRLPMRAHQPLSAAEQRVLDRWFDLRRAAYLIGGFCLRGAVLQHLGYLRCDPALRRFIMLPLPVPAHAGEIVVSSLDESCLLACGVEAFAPLFASLDPAWRARAALLFPESAAPALLSGRRAPINQTLIQLAFHHAQNS